MTLGILTLWRLSPVLGAALVLDGVVMGAAFGNLLTAIGPRLSDGEHLHHGLWMTLRRAPRCPHCAALIRRKDNWPIISYIRLHGRCRACSRPIGLRYLVTEIAGAVLTGLAVVIGGATLNVIFLWIACWALLVFSTVGVDLAGWARQKLDARELSREEKIRAVRAANAASAAASAAKEGVKGITLSNELGPFYEFRYDHGAWKASLFNLVAGQGESGWLAEVRAQGPQAKAILSPLPGSTPNRRAPIAEGWSYGPFQSLSQLRQALRIPATRHTLETLLEALDASEIKLLVLRARLVEALEDASTEGIKNAQTLGVWLSHLDRSLADAGHDRGVAEAIQALKQQIRGG